MIVDRLIFSLINKNMISEEDFNKESNYWYLSEKSKRVIVSEYDKYMKQKVRYKALHRDVSYRHLIRLECYKLVRSLVEGETYEPYVMGW